MGLTWNRPSRTVNIILDDCMKACTIINVDHNESVAILTKGEDASGELITMFLDNQAVDSTMVIDEDFTPQRTPEKERAYCLV